MSPQAGNCEEIADTIGLHGYEVSDGASARLLQFRDAGWADAPNLVQAEPSVLLCALAWFTQIAHAWSIAILLRDLVCELRNCFGRADSYTGRYLRYATHRLTYLRAEGDQITRKAAVVEEHL